MSIQVAPHVADEAAWLAAALAAAPGVARAEVDATPGRPRPRVLVRFEDGSRRTFSGSENANLQYGR